jgi:hypothetical protein
MSKWYCLDCRKTVDIQSSLGIFPISCKICKGIRVMKLEKVEQKEFDKFVEDFKSNTDKLG